MALKTPIRSFWCKGCVLTYVMSENNKTKSAVLFRLLTITIEALKKEIGRSRSRVINTQKEKVEKNGSA